MSADAASLTPRLEVRTVAVPRLRIALLLAGLLLAFALRLALVWLRATPNYFPDEYLYAALGRSLGGFHGASVRGHAAHFPALLQPLLTGPAWRAGSVETGYRIVQAIGAAAFTLAAVPAFLLARRVGLARGAALAVAALTLLVPDALYAGLVIAEPLAYPLALAAAAAAVAALATPTRRMQVAFLLLAGLATFARVQFGVLPICFAVAALALGLRERSLRRVLREQRLPLAAIGVAVALGAAGAAVRGLGYYASSANFRLDPVAVSKAVGANVTVLLYAGGWVLAPGAALGLALALARPRTRSELAFGVFAVLFGVALLLEAALWGDTSMVQERYLFYVLPLGAIGFGLQASRGWPHRRAHAVLALMLVGLAARIPLAGYARPGTDDHSPFLLAVQKLEPTLGNAGAATLVAAIATGCALAAAAAGWRPKIATPLLLGIALALSTASLVGATAFDRTNALSVQHRYLPADHSWVDHAHVGTATLVTAFGGRPADASEQLFWNRSLQHVAVLPGASPPDRLGAANLRIADDGTLVMRRGGALRGPLAVDGFGTTVVLRGAKPVAHSPHFTLWPARGKSRVALYIPGRSSDGYLGGNGAIMLWPDRSPLAGWLELNLRALPGKAIRVRLGTRVMHAGRVRIAVCSTGRWALPFATQPKQIVGGRPAGAQMSLPRFVPDAAACPASGASA